MASRSIPANTPRGQRLRSLALVGVVLLTPLLFVGRPDWLPGGFNFAAWNLGHVVLFALLTLAVNPRRWLNGWHLWLASTAAVLTFGMVVETVQAGMGRDFDLRDLLRNLIGLWIVLAWQPLLAFRVRNRATTAVLALTSSLLLAYELSTTGVQAARYFKLEHQLPQVYDFDHSDPSSYWRGSIEPSSQHNGDHDQSLKIELGTKRYSAASLYRVPSDWRDFDTLNLRLHNPAPEPLTLILRINDIQHERGSNALNDRYNTRLTLAPGVSSHTIALDDIEKAPASRTMNLRQVRRLTLFATERSGPQTVYLQELRLD